MMINLRSIKWKKYITIELICAIIIFGMVIYFISTRQKRWYPFQGLSEQAIDYANNRASPFSYKVQIKPRRSTSKREEMVRDILEKIYGKKFIPIRPDFLKNPATGRNLEIDCYNEEMNLGVEVDGKQHSEYVPHFHENAGAFRYQVAKDDFKKKKCQLVGVTLINIPHFVHTDDIERYLRLKLKIAGKLV